MVKDPAKSRADIEEYKSLGGTIDSIRLIDTDRSSYYSVDAQYIAMGLWAFKHLIEDKPLQHFDIGSQVAWISSLTPFMSVIHVDIRDPDVKFPNFQFIRGDITNLPFNDESVFSLSCLHVAEHIGLGRYGDEIDPNGFYKACKELQRVIIPGGKLYFAVPIGIKQTVFNAHRVIPFGEVTGAFDKLNLIEFTSMDSKGNCGNSKLLDDSYGCGMFLFGKDI